jgi:hypothetical protein
VAEVEERNEDWRMELESDYEELIALITCIGTVDVHLFEKKINLKVHLFNNGGSTLH